VSWLSVALLACAVVAVIGAEWPRLSRTLGVEGRERRHRERRKAQFRVVPGEGGADETDDFAASVERDLAQLPTIDERDRRK
jgi:hypothetical protein